MNDATKHPVNFADCYVLTTNRTKAFIQAFLNHFLPFRLPYTSTYEVPQLADHPTAVFHADDELLQYLEQNKNELYAVYWHNKKEELLRGVMCHYTSDGQVIVGLFCETLYPDTANEDQYLQALKDFCQSTNGLIEYQTPAAHDTAEFLERIRTQTEKKQ